MKAACFHGPLDLTCEEVEKPQCKPKDILIKVGACGICGSDLHFYKLGLFKELLGRPTEKGLVPGHEFGGEVIEVGEQVEGIAVGDRVTAITFGAMADYVPVSPAYLGRNVYKLPDEIGFEEAATLEPLATSYHAAKLGEPVQGETAVIFGAGIIGLGIIQSLKALEMDLKNLIVVDVSEKRLEMARQLGATYLLNPKKEDVSKTCRDITGEARILNVPGETTPVVDLVYDAVGYIVDHGEIPVVQQATEITRYNGRVVVVGVFEAPVRMEFMPLVNRQIRLRGSYGYLHDEVRECIDLVRTKKIRRKPLITHRFPLEQAREAFEVQARSQESIKVLLIP